MTTHVAQYVRLVAALAGAKVLRRLTTLVPQVTLETVLPLVVTVTVAAHPRLLQALGVHNVPTSRERFCRVGALLDLSRGTVFRRGPPNLSITSSAERLERLLSLTEAMRGLVL